MTLKSNTFEGGTNGTTYTAGASGGASGTAFDTGAIGADATRAWSTAQAMHGAVSLLFSIGTGTANNASVGYAGYTATSIAERFYFRLTALPSVNSLLTAVFLSDGGAIRVEIEAAGTLRIGNRAGTRIATSSTLSLNTWYRLERVIIRGTTSTNGTINYALYAGDSTTALSSFSTAATDTGTTQTISNIQWGRPGATAATTAYSVYLDDVAVNDGSATFLGPAASPSFSGLTDTYATLDGAKWVYAGNASIVGGRLQLTTSATEEGAKSLATRSLVGTSVSLEVVQTAGPGNNTVDTTLLLSADANNSMSFTREGTLLYAQRTVAGVITTISQPTYSATNHRWWRFAESGGQVLWQVSSDGITWATLGTPWTPTFPITNLYAELITGYYGTEPTPGVALFDNFNLPPAANVSPTANAGPDQTNVEPWATVILAGTDSDSDGTVVTRTWTQTSGPAVTLAGTGATRTFTAPGTVAGATLTFQYVVTDNGGATSTPSTTTVTVLPAAERILINGSWVPCRFRTV